MVVDKAVDQWTEREGDVHVDHYEHLLIYPALKKVAIAEA